VLDFAHRDLEILRPEERVALGYDLRSIAVSMLPLGAGGHGGLTIAPPGAMPDDALRGYQRAIADGLRTLLGRHPEPWPIPAQPALALRPMGSTRRADNKGPRFRVIFQGDERAGILGAVAQLVIEEGDLLRSCRECGRPFVRVRRQEYCSVACSQRTRNRRMTEKAARQNRERRAKGRRRR
jgi:hypothetical protein